MSVNINERNRLNAKKSSGPKTPEGKARSSRNSLKTGLYSTTALLPDEDPEEYRKHAESYALSLRPQDPVQADLVKILSDNVWCLRRIRGLIAHQTAEVSRVLKSDVFLERQATEIRTLESLSRQEHRLQNAVGKTLKLLKDLQKELPREEELPEPSETESGFVPHTEFSAAAAAESTPQPPTEITQNALATDTPEDRNQAA